MFILSQSVMERNPIEEMEQAQSSGQFKFVGGNEGEAIFTRPKPEASLPPIESLSLHSPSSSYSASKKTDDPPPPVRKDSASTPTPAPAPTPVSTPKPKEPTPPQDDDEFLDPDLDLEDDGNYNYDPDVSFMHSKINSINSNYYCM